MSTQKEQSLDVLMDTPGWNEPNRRDLLRLIGQGALLLATPGAFSVLSAKDAEASPHGITVIEPSDAYRIISDFKSWYGVRGRQRRMQHRGVDWKAPAGTPVLAPADGYVYSTQPLRRGGNRVTIIHTDNPFPNPNTTLRTRYLHLRETLCAEGDTIKRGDVVGTVGATGTNSTGLPHLHYDLWSGGGGVRCCKNENLHEYWFDGRGKVTLFKLGQDYSAKNHLITCPLPGKSDLSYFQEKLRAKRR